MAENAITVKAKSLNAFLMERKHTLGALAAKHITPERLVKGFLSVASRNPKLLDCTPISILNCCIIAGELGLEIGRPMGGMHVVPFKNVATPIPDYRGLIDLAYRSGMVLSVEADTVRQNDQFDYQRGTDSRLFHKPASKNRGNIIGFYAVAHIRDGRPVFEYLTTEEVDGYRDKSPAYQYAVNKGSNDTPWIANYEPMGKKTCVRRLANWLPQNPETDLFHRAVELDSRVEVGESISGLFDVELEAEEVTTRTQGVKDKLDAQGDSGEGDATRTRGRPPGAKNKVKDDPPPAQPDDPGPQDDPEGSPPPDEPGFFAASENKLREGLRMGGVEGLDGVWSGLIRNHKDSVSDEDWAPVLALYEDLRNS